MRRTVLAGLALIGLVACKDAKKPAPATRPPAVKSHTASPRVTTTTKPRAKKTTTLARKPVRAAPAQDTAEARNPLLNH
jgi:hypothetical protein